MIPMHNIIKQHQNHMQEATERAAVTKTLDSNYKAADLTRDMIVNKNAKYPVDNE